MRLSTIIISIMLVGLVFTGLYTFTNSLTGADAYNVPVDDSYLGTYQKINETNTEIRDSYNDMLNWSTKKGSAIQIITLVPDALSLLKNIIVTPISIMWTMVSDTMDVVGIPDYAHGFVIGLLTLIVIFALVSAVLRYDKT